MTDEDRRWIVDLIHNEYDPKPSYYKPTDNWNDGTDEIAKLVIERFAQPESLSGCLHPGKFGCQHYGKCISVSCDHYGKTEYRPRMTVLAQADGILYPKVET